MRRKALTAVVVVLVVLVVAAAAFLIIWYRNSGLSSSAMTSVDPALIKGRTVTLDGEQALQYCRARYNVGDETNMERMERQRQYILALWRQVNVKTEESSNFLANVFAEIASYLRTNCSNAKMMDLFEAVGDLDLSEVLTTKGRNVMGEEYVEFYVDEEALMEQVMELFYNRIED